MSFPNSPFNSGFPFDDRDFDRDRSHSSFRSQLDDIARRHPEFAEHLNIGSGGGGGAFPFRSHTLGRHRDRRGTDFDKPSGSQDAEFRRHHPNDRQFPRFDQFNFPFRKYFDEEVPDFYETGYRAQPNYAHGSTQTQPTEEAPQYQQRQQQTAQQADPSSGSSAEKPPQPPQNREGSRKQSIQQSNTVDLGQKQEPVDDNRGQRSMSAPPENRSTGQRYVSSIHIPIQRPGAAGGDMGAKASSQAPPEPGQAQQQNNKPNERVIPIHVEGRDEPIIPKNVNATFTQSPPQPQPQGEKIFGRNPSHFTQFVNRGEPQHMTPEDYRQQQQTTPEEYYRQQQQMTPEEYYRQQQQQFQKKRNLQQQNQQPQEEVPPQPQPPKSTQLDQIQNIQKDVSELMNKVEKFNGKPRDKEYLYLDEMLTRNLIKLDNIETEGKDNIRQARKEAIKCIEGCIGILEAKANANLAAELQSREQKMDVVQEEEKPQESSQANPEKTEAPSTTTVEAPKIEQSQNEPATLEVSGVTRSGSVANVTPMEVTTVVEDNKEVPVPAQNQVETDSQTEQPAPALETQTQGEDPKQEIKKEGAKKGKRGKSKEKSAVEETKTEESMTVESAKPEDKSDTTSNPNESEKNAEDVKEKKKGKKKEKGDKK